MKKTNKKYKKKKSIKNNIVKNNKVKNNEVKNNEVKNNKVKNNKVKNKKIKSCCKIKDRDKKCIRDDGKIFDLPRRFSKKKCLKEEIKGFSMRSSCAPYKNCKKK